MSTIKATNIQHPSASSPNFTLAADGSVSGGAGLGGLVHIHTEDFTAVSSVSIDNVFSATYDNYRVVINIIGRGSTPYAVRYRFRVSGSDATGSDYNNRITNNYGTSVVVETFTNTYGEVQCANSGASEILMFDPFAARNTKIFHRAFNNIADTFGTGVLVHGQAVSYTGLTVFPNTGTVTGTLRIYGYANS